KIFIGKRSIRVDETTVGKEKFISFVKKQYRKSHDGNSIPLTKPKSDIFNGNISNPGEFIFAYSLVLGFIFLCIIVCISIGISNSSKEFLNSTESFVRYEVDDNILKLYTNDNKEYRIGNYKDVVADLGGLLRLCNGKEKLDVTYTLHDDDSNPVYRLNSITTKSSTVLLSADEVDALNKSGVRSICIGFGIVIALMLGFFGTSIYVGRNADKLKPWIVKLFFKSSYVNWK
ncbi:MAG: hypothetical protein IKY44_03440, partial [Clostridia bacterium]|nr:hypothetical protein [Clostridia bacterium]